MASRSAFPRSGAAALAIVTAIVVGACGSSGATSPGGGTGTGGGNGGAASAAPAGAVVTDACTLLTPADVQGVIGFAVTKTEPYKDAGQSGCTWSWPSTMGDSTDDVTIQVMSPGGKADFASNRSFIGSFDAGLSSAMPSLVASAGTLFQETDLSGLGDAAFVGPGYVLFVVKGDTEFKVEPGFIDPDVDGKLVKLAKIAVGHF
jgi:hypothetical protein